MESKFSINGINYTFSCKEEVKIEFKLLEQKDGISFYSVQFHWPRLINPKPIRLYYRIPMSDIYSTWDPESKTYALSFGGIETKSRLASGMPIKQLLSKTGVNRYLLSVSDAKTPITIKSSAMSRFGSERIIIDFFTKLTGPFSDYSAVIRIDERAIPFDKAVMQARDWFSELGYAPAKVPAAAKQPMYSTWYSLWQTMTAKEVLAECRKAVKLGMKTVIIDDGWQPTAGDATYVSVGDWRPDRRNFGDLKALVQKLHALDMKVMLWFSVPFMGYKAANYERFKGKYLSHCDSSRCSVLDPRYKEVREFLVQIYVDAVNEWDLDGLKLDFIDMFASNGEVTDEMDFISVEDAAEQLLKEIHIALNKVKPDMLIEFRQPYYGPVMSTYGNMIRVADCPLDGMTNRIGSLSLRLISGGCAVHSDMIYWHSTDTLENIAVQLFGTMFSVPQISVRFEEITKEQKAVLTNYLNFWNSHSDILMNGDLSVQISESGYGYAAATGNGKCLALAVSKPYLEAKEPENYLVNCTDTSKIILKAEKGCTYEVFDCTGKRICRKRKTRGALTEVEVPMGGLLHTIDK